MQTIRIDNINYWVTVSFDTDRITDPSAVDRFQAVLITITDNLQPRGRVAINFEGVDNISSQVIGLLMKLRERILAKNGELVLCKLNPRVQDLMKVINVAHLFKYSDNLNQLVGARKQSKPISASTRTKVSGDISWMD